MPYHESPFGSGRYRYFDPVKIYEEGGLPGAVRHILEWMHRNHRVWQDKYDLFAMFPLLEQIDYERQIYEAIYPVRIEDRREGDPHCCWPYPCVMCAAIGCTVHWGWREHFQKKMPYWRKDISVP